MQPGHMPQKLRTLNISVLSLLCVAVIVSLRNLPVAAHYGFASLFFYALAALLFLFPYSLISAELASGWPKAGGIYIWVREAFGDRWGFFAIWMQWFHNMTWYPAMLAFLGSAIAYLFFDPSLAESKTFLLCVILIGIWGITLINFFGIKISSSLSAFCVVVGTIFPGTLLIILAIIWIILGRPLATPLNAGSFLPDLTSLSSIVFLAGVVLALSGMESTANFAREVRSPQKNYPKAIGIAALITLGLLGLGSAAISVVIPAGDISLVAGLLNAFDTFLVAFHMDWIMPFMAICVALGAIGELNAWTIAGAKGLFVTSEHGLLPPIFHKTNRARTPVNLLLLQALIVTISAFVFLYLPNVNISYWMLSALSTQMYTFVYLFLFPTALRLRHTKPNVDRPYRIPFGKWAIWIVSIVGFLTTLFALIVSFFPPGEVGLKDVFKYELLLCSSIGVIIALPLIIYSLRRPHWKLEALHEMREEIHRTTH